MFVAELRFERVGESVDRREQLVDILEQGEEAFRASALAPPSRRGNRRTRRVERLVHPCVIAPEDAGPRDVVEVRSSGDLVRVRSDVAITLRDRDARGTIDPD